MKCFLIQPVVIALFLLLGVHRSSGQQYVHTTNLDVVAETTLASATPDYNLGYQAFVIAGVDNYGTNRSLVQFDATPIPTNATIKNVTLSLAALSSPPAGVPFALSRMLSHWGQTASTWNRRYYSPPSWAVPGGLAGTDFNSVPSALAPAADPMTFSDNGSNATSGLVYDVQQWVSHPAQNFGWILAAADEGPTNSVFEVSFTLTVDYTQPITPPLIHDVLISNGYFQFSFDVEPYHGYVVQHCDDLTRTNWLFGITFDPVTFPTVATYYDTLTTSNRFYRLVTQ